jgi:alpha-mannosidase
LLRGVNGTGYVTGHTRPQTPDFLELRSGRHNTVLFPGGLPFLQRYETRMLDVILVPAGETATVFELGISLDRDHPMQTALGLTTPVPVLATEKGPPHVGAAGWLFHLDTSNLLLTGLRPGGLERREVAAEPAGDLTDAVTARLLECAALSGQAEFRCVRNPHRAVLLDARGNRLLEAATAGDAVQFEVTPGDFVQVQVEFT